MRGTPTYRTWAMMKTRCQNPNSSDYPKYGGRGIKVCDKWQTFKGFLSDMGTRPKNKTLDRIDNDGNYCPDNCRWATKTEQQRNKSNARILTYKGESLPLFSWAERLNVNPSTLSTRLDRGWSVVRIIETPVRIYRA